MPTWHLSKASTTYGCICLAITHVKTFYATPNDTTMAPIQSCCYHQYLERRHGKGFDKLELLVACRQGSHVTLTKRLTNIPKSYTTKFPTFEPKKMTWSTNCRSIDDLGSPNKSHHLDCMTFVHQSFAKPCCVTCLLTPNLD
jgi:hypothetical protein